METFSINDTEAMSLAMRIARLGRHKVKSNPMVGCVIVKDEVIVAQGYHQQFGGNHAEINALENINYKAEGATLFVTLEPCSHTGKTPPCTKAIIDSGAKKVVIAMLDPNPNINGEGVKMLINAGIEVKTGLLEDEATKLNRGFVKRMKVGRPFVTCKVAMSIDGKTSMTSGESKWITGDAARIDVHRLRHDNQAILTGSGTVALDDPKLTVRLDDVISRPLRVVVDSTNIIADRSLNIFSDDSETLILNQNNTKTLDSGKIDLNDALQHLGGLGINYVLLESGPGLISAMIDSNLIDEFVIYCAPVLMGGHANSMNNLIIRSMSDKIQLSISDIRMVGSDIKIIASINSTNQ
ncbi:MAG: bifunctional diaminohydroxyphosphoribosylaminopyrimidine deaminase/5-amino-6-(5-phosphoribosylamino)uracil reductase RibD [PS1 clade bacterium]|jgi:diaminohydroxyphosphoribosylaminopyrimidine deaminase/5-amino-6-(5-phosphoribosylamino)uracil reductase